MKQFLVTFSSIVLAGYAFGASGTLASLLVPLEDIQKEDASYQEADASVTDASEAAAPMEIAEDSAGSSSIEAANSVMITLDELLPVLRSRIEDAFAPEGGLEISAMQPWRDIKVPGKEWSVELLRVSGQQLSSHIVASFGILYDGQPVGHYQMQLACSLKQDVLVATRYLNKGTALSKSDFEVQSRDVLEMKVKPIPATESLGGYELSNALGGGRVLYWRDLAARPVMKRGQVVDAVAMDGGMRIAVKALVLEDGCEGEFVSVRNLSSNKDIQARILNERTVQVYF